MQQANKMCTFGIEILKQFGTAWQVSIFFIFKTPPSTLPSVSLVYPSLHVSGSHTAKLFLAHTLQEKLAKYAKDASSE